MLTLPPSIRVYLASGPVDMRCGHDGLLAVVRSRWDLDPYSGHLFLFLGRQRDRAKILYWDRGGFVLYYKRLERGRFKLPKVTPEQDRIELDSADLTMLLEGIDVSTVRRPPKWRPASIERPIAPIDPQ